MALFNFIKKEEKLKEGSCTCNGGCSTSEAKKQTSFCYGEDADSIFCVKVLGSGCSSCHQLYENTKVAIKNAGVSVEVEYVTDMEKVMKYGVMRMPALVINEKVVSVGRILKANEVEELLHK